MPISVCSVFVFVHCLCRFVVSRFHSGGGARVILHTITFWARVDLH